VIPAEVQQGQGGQARQSFVRQQLDAVLLQVEFLQTLQMANKKRQQGGENEMSETG